MKKYSKPYKMRNFMTKNLKSIIYLFLVSLFFSAPLKIWSMEDQDVSLLKDNSKIKASDRLSQIRDELILKTNEIREDYNSRKLVNIRTNGRYGGYDSDDYEGCEDYCERFDEGILGKLALIVSEQGLFESHTKTLTAITNKLTEEIDIIKENEIEDVLYKNSPQREQYIIRDLQRKLEEENNKIEEKNKEILSLTEKYSAAKTALEISNGKKRKRELENEEDHYGLKRFKKSVVDSVLSGVNPYCVIPMLVTLYLSK